MKAGKKSSSIVLVPATLLILASSSQLFAGNHPAVAQWDLQPDTAGSSTIS